jgi:DNA-binding NarL/FixJ family response regulator
MKLTDKRHQPETPKITLLIADDHRLVRDGIRSLFSGEPDIEIIGEAGDGTEAIALVEKFRPSVVLMDIAMPHKSGLDATEEIVKRFPLTKVIMLSMHDDAEYIIKSMKSGASGYLLKNQDKAGLLTAIRGVVAGEKQFRQNVTEIVMQSFSAPSPKAESRKVPLHESILLTSREKEILRCVADGLSTKEIAQKLFISPRTVDTHRNNIMRKLDTQNAAEMVKLALLNRLLD